MKKINLSNILYYGFLGVLASVILFMLYCVFINNNGHIIAHFSIASSLIALRDNPFIKHSETSLEKKDFLMQEAINNLFRKAIKKEIKNNDKHFYLVDNLFISSKKDIVKK